MTASAKKGTFKVTKTWISRAGLPRAKFQGIGTPKTVRQLLQGGKANTKTAKNDKLEFQTATLSLSPARESGYGNTCGMHSFGCAQACLDHQGLPSVFLDIRRCRIAKTVAFYAHRDWFLDRLNTELDNATRLAAKNGKQLVARLNMFSDIPWEKLGIVDRHPEIQFYDYTKFPNRAGLVRPNYWVTFSRSESNQSHVDKVLGNGGNVAVVFADVSRATGFTGNRSHLQRIPKTWKGYKVISGNNTDLRHLDTRCSKIVGLSLRASSNLERSQAIDSGFAVQCFGGSK